MRFRIKENRFQGLVERTRERVYRVIYEILCIYKHPLRCFYLGSLPESVILAINQRPFSLRTRILPSIWFISRLFCSCVVANGRCQWEERAAAIHYPLNFYFRFYFLRLKNISRAIKRSGYSAHKGARGKLRSVCSGSARKRPQRELYTYLSRERFPLYVYIYLYFFFFFHTHLPFILSLLSLFSANRSRPVPLSRSFCQPIPAFFYFI